MIPDPSCTGLYFHVILLFLHLTEKARNYFPGPITYEMQKASEIDWFNYSMVISPVYGIGCHYLKHQSPKEHGSRKSGMEDPEPDWTVRNLVVLLNTSKIYRLSDHFDSDDRLDLDLRIGRCKSSIVGICRRYSTSFN